MYKIVMGMLASLMVVCCPLTADAVVRSGPVARPVAAPALTEAGKMVEDYFNGIATLRAHFTQQATGDSFVQEGEFYLRRPRQFLWQYETPDRQKVISTGTAIYFVDQERGDRVTQLPTNVGLARLFNTKVLSLARQGMEVTGARVTGNQLLIDLKMLEKTRLNDQAGLVSLRMVFARRPMVLQRIDALDTTGVTTSVSFSNLQTGVELPRKLFDFVPPQYREN